MLTFISLLIFLLTTTTAQPYKPTDAFYLDCGTSSTSNTIPRWDGDESSKFVLSNIATTSFSSTPDQMDPSVPPVPYSTARIINTSSFTYAFPVSQGPKFLRLHFYPATYSGLNKDKSFFSVTSNGYSLLTNFSAILTVTAPYIQDKHLIKEYIVYVSDTQILNVTFMPSPNSYAFINGIEIVSIPPNLYLNATNPPKYFAQTTGPEINEKMALETMYRLNMGGQDISGKDDTGMNRIWHKDDIYIYFAAYGWTPRYSNSITYTTETPNYTAPEIVYQTQRSMGNLSELYNLTWILPVDSGFFYMLRLHFCNIISNYTKEGQMFFRIFITNQTAEDEADLFHWTQGSGYPVYKDYAVLVSSQDGPKSKQDLWVALHPNERSIGYSDGYLNGLEVFKMSMSGILSSPNMELLYINIPADGKKSKKVTRIVVGCVIGGVVLVLVLLVGFFIWSKFGRAKRAVVGEKPESNIVPSNGRSSYTGINLEFTVNHPSPISSLNLNLRFPLDDILLATNNFDEKLMIGKGGFGKVYKGILNNDVIVAVKRGEKGHGQGRPEFVTEIMVLSKIRHQHLVTLIGYCDEKSEMILVFEYMEKGTLQDHLYDVKDNPKLSWSRRLEICISATRGLHYLHTGSDAGIIHRDVKSTNILLNEKYVAKVADFGISRIDNVDEGDTTNIKGSFGYLDPEYINCMKLTQKSDVYSFGVVLLEVLCARPALDNTLPPEERNLANWAIRNIKNVQEIIDPFLVDTISPKSLTKFLGTVERCLKDTGDERPGMIDLLWDLEYALRLQQMDVDKDPYDDSTMNSSLQLPMSFLSRLPSNINDDDSEVNHSSVTSYPSESHVFPVEDR